MPQIWHWSAAWQWQTPLKSISIHGGWRQSIGLLRWYRDVDSISSVDFSKKFQQYHCSWIILRTPQKSGGSTQNKYFLCSFQEQFVKKKKRSCNPPKNANLPWVPSKLAWGGVQRRVHISWWERVPNWGGGSCIFYVASSQPVLYTTGLCILRRNCQRPRLVYP